MFGIFPRACFALLVPLYLSYAAAGRDLLAFQWDSLLLECGLLAVFLPRDREASWIHLLFRVLLFKVYFESGLAKWQSSLGDWHDGSAMTLYYETAPLPTLLAWYAHQLPEWWHHLESRATLVLELAVPFGVFGGRRLRLAAFFALTGFQLLNLATANYGFFVYLVLSLHLFLLDDRDLRWLPEWLRRPRAPAAPRRVPRRWEPARRAAAIALCVFFAVASSVQALRTFTDLPRLRELTEPLQSAWEPFRLVNTYHLFGHITRERIEAEFQTRQGDTWTPHDFWYKAGPLDRAPPFVAPHQPRVDFRLWFYGLGFRRGVPRYAGTLLHRMCTDPAAVEPLFTSPLPASPEAVRIVFGRYHFTTPDEREATGAWWKRRWLAMIPEVSCAEARGDP
ncbi:MAG: lipase maturation factor family protein [Deltaproteobacteria bacterium]|nr:lipase maturation factor family protein [Deltaproteobacteria bacterium]